MNMDKNNQTTTADFTCTKCGRVFLSARALMMHDIRKHTGRNWNSVANFKKKKKHRYPSDDPEIKRRKYHAMVAEYRALGLNSRGKPLKSKAPAEQQQSSPEIWVMLSSGTIRCPHCHKLVGEIKTQQQQEDNKWHVV